MNTIQPQYNNNKYQVPFNSLKRIKWYGKFNPYEHLGDAKVYQAFKKSEPIKEFFKKYDGTVNFIRGSGIGPLSHFEEVRWFDMEINYTLEKPEKKWLKRQVQNIKNFVLDFLSEEPYEKHTINVPLSDEHSLDFIDQTLKQSVNEAEEAVQRKAEEYKLINKLLSE